MVGGYMGRVLVVDLSRYRVTREPLTEEVCRRFLGGYGIGAYVLFNQQRAGVDALGPENTLGFVTGPITGTPALSGTRYTVVGKSPLTGGWGDANSGGHFGAYLKFAGYDAVFFTGVSERPVYLFINNGEAELRDASHLWGKDTYETERMLKSELGTDVQIACIGPAGEKLSLISAIMHDKGRAAARSGLGAVMGSKRLKALAVKGSMMVPLANEGRCKELRRKYLKELVTGAAMRRRYGTASILIPCVETGDTPTKNWSGAAVVDLPSYRNLSANAVIDRQNRRYTCYRCPIGCGGHMKEGTGEYLYEGGVHKPEYETLAMLGPLCCNDNLESIIKLNDICNRYGLDTISVGGTVAFAIECYENGLISKTETDGIELTWGNHKAIVAMVERLANKEGFGDVLADGARLAAQRIGRGADKYAIHIQGQEVPAHDPKFAVHLISTYILDPTPARHTQGSEEHHPPGLIPRFNRKALTGRGEAHRRGSNFHHAVVCAGWCVFVYVSLPAVDAVAEFMNAVTGWELTTEELLQAGERIANMRQAFNIREGLNPLEFRVPGRIFGRPPLEAGPLAGVSIDEKPILEEYLTAMDWDAKTARPSKKKLEELGLEDVARELYRQ
ncbi:MAG: aldehyde ferredoxin oxidoreductase family protein [Moorellaceae bacterium]